MFADPHLAERGFFPEVRHPVAGPVTQIGSPLRFSRTPVRIDWAGPSLGANNVAILREAGLDDGEIAELVDAGIVTRT